MAYHHTLFTFYLSSTETYPDAWPNLQDSKLRRNARQSRRKAALQAMKHHTSGANPNPSNDARGDNDTPPDLRETIGSNDSAQLMHEDSVARSLHSFASRSRMSQADQVNYDRRGTGGGGVDSQQQSFTAREQVRLFGHSGTFRAVCRHICPFVSSIICLSQFYLVNGIPVRMYLSGHCHHQQRTGGVPAA